MLPHSMAKNLPKILAPQRRLHAHLPRLQCAFVAMDSAAAQELQLVPELGDLPRPEPMIDATPDDTQVIDVAYEVKENGDTISYEIEAKCVAQIFHPPCPTLSSAVIFFYHFFYHFPRPNPDPWNGIV